MFINGRINNVDIDIRYERAPYEMDYKDENDIIKHTHPDFYFPKYDVYLEHWAVDKDNKSVFDGYEAGMNKKKKHVNLDSIGLIIIGGGVSFFYYYFEKTILASPSLTIFITVGIILLISFFTHTITTL